MELFYKAYKDYADNIGIRCLACRRIFWKKNFDTIDPTTGEPCINCVNMNTAGTFDKEKSLHAAELQNEVECVHELAFTLVDENTVYRP